MEMSSVHSWGAPRPNRSARMGPQFEVLNPGSFSSLRVTLKKGESLRAESNALVSRSEHVELRSTMEGGLFGGLARSFLSGESMFMQTLHAMRGDDNDVLLAPEHPGDIMLCNLDGTVSTSLYLMSGSFLAAEHGVRVETTAQLDFKKALFGAGLFVLHASGVGTLAIHSFGSLVRYDLGPGEKRVVDNGHVVAWSETTQHTVAMASRSLFTTVSSGEGMMCHFIGPGTIYVQSHSAMASGGGQSARRTANAAAATPIIGICFICCFVFIFIIIIGVIVSFGGNGTSASFTASTHNLGTGGRWD